MDSYEPENLSARESYHLLTSLIVPRPIALVTSESREGVLNCAPFSFFQGVCGNPPILSLSIARRKQSLKDTFRNILMQSEFVVHVPRLDDMDAVEKAAGQFPPEVSEVEETGFTPVDSDIVNVEGLKQLPVRMECRLHDQVPIAGGKVTVLFGEVLKFHIAHGIYDDETEQADYGEFAPLSRVGWNRYGTIHETYIPDELSDVEGRIR